LDILRNYKSMSEPEPVSKDSTTLPVENVPESNITSAMLGSMVRDALFPDRTKAAPYSGLNHRWKSDLGKVHCIQLETTNPANAHKQIVFFHGNLRSANQCVDILQDLAQYGTVYGVNLPGYEESTLPPEGKKMAEVAHVAAARCVVDHISSIIASNGGTNSDVIAIGRSVGTRSAIELATRLRGAHCALIVPVGRFEDLPGQLLSTTGLGGVGAYVGKEFGPMAARAAFPIGMVHPSLPDFTSNCFDNIQALEHMSEKLPSTFTAFVAPNDNLIPVDAGKMLVEANGGIGTVKLMKDGHQGHKTLPDRADLDELFYEKLGWNRYVQDLTHSLLY
jgi:pimeloyl-ACP methyl ester carboxylesterase